MRFSEMLAAVVHERLRSQTMLPVRIFFAVLLVAVVAIGLYVIHHRKKFFSPRDADRTTDSPAAGNLRMWMIVLVLIHAAILLALMIFEV